MKKLMFVWLAVLPALPGLSQATHPVGMADPVLSGRRTHIGLITGVNFAKLTTQSAGLTVTTSAVAAFRAGMLLDYSLGKGIYFQPEALLSGKGGKLHLLGTEGSVRPYYLEVPLNFLYKLDAGPGRAFAGLGPYLAAGLFGKSRSKGPNATLSHDLRFGNGDNDDLRAPDFGANFLLGYELRAGWLLSVNYSQGIYNILPHASNDGKGKNHYFGISLGYLIGKR